MRQVKLPNFTTISTAIKSEKMKGTPWNLISTREKDPENYNKLYDFMEYMYTNTKRQKCLVFVDSNGNEHYHDLKWNIDHIHSLRKEDKQCKITNEDAIDKALQLFIDNFIEQSDPNVSECECVIESLDNYNVKSELLYDVRNIFARIDKKNKNDDIEQKIRDMKTTYFITIRPFLLLHFKTEISNSNIEFVGDMLDGNKLNSQFDYIIFEATMQAPIETVGKPNLHISKKKMKRNSKIKQCSISENLKEPQDEPQCEPQDEPQCEPQDEPQCEPQDEPQCEPQCEPQDEPQCEPQDEPQNEPQESDGFESDLSDNGNYICIRTNNGLEVSFKYWIEETERLHIMECINKAIDKKGYFYEFISDCSQIRITNKLHVGRIDIERIQQHFNMILIYKHTANSSVIHVYANEFNEITKYTQLSVVNC